MADGLRGTRCSGLYRRGMRAWRAGLDGRNPFHYPVGEFDYPVSDAEGPEMTKRVKLFPDEDHYVEFRSFRETSRREGEVVELEVPNSVLGPTR